jgi:hypothetical protein
MNGHIQQLRQYALMEANRIRAMAEAGFDVAGAYLRAQGMEELICPRCWVKSAVWSEIAPTDKNIISSATIYECVSCDFEEAFFSENT